MLHLEETARAHDKSTYQPQAEPWLRELNTAGLWKVATALSIWKDGQLLCVDCGKLLVDHGAELLRRPQGALLTRAAAPGLPAGGPFPDRESGNDTEGGS